MVSEYHRFKDRSRRLHGWDYSGKGYYFITIVTQNRECNLGKIENAKMVLSEFGMIVEKEWLRSFDIRDELILDEYVIMPNHIHAIVIIDVGTHGRAFPQSENGRAFPQSENNSADPDKSDSGFTGRVLP